MRMFQVLVMPQAVQPMVIIAGLPKVEENIWESTFTVCRNQICESSYMQMCLPAAMVLKQLVCALLMFFGQPQDPNGADEP